MFNQQQFAQQPVQNYEGQPQFERATIFERMVALAIDFLGLFAVIYLTCYILITQMGIFPAKLYWLILLFYYALFILYCGFFSIDGRQTLGKFLVGIKIIDRSTGGSLTFKKAAIRAAVYFLNLFTLFFGFVLALLNKRRLALQDYITGSEVISVREKSPTETIILSALGTMLMAGLAFYAYYLFFIAPSSFQQELIDNAQNQVNDIAKLEEAHKIHFGKYTNDLNRLALISGDPVQFQRDMQKNLRREGFSIGLTMDRSSYQIRGKAKDKEQTVVTITNKK